MDVKTLAEALAKSRRPDGAVSIRNLDDHLRRVGLDELARAVGLLARRASVHAIRGAAGDKPRPWG